MNSLDKKEEISLNQNINIAKQNRNPSEHAATGIDKLKTRNF
jgi:hypothetical protein